MPEDVAVDAAGNLYVADAGSTVSKITPAGQLTVIAGTGVTGPTAPGLATRSMLGSPVAVAVDHAGNVYIADATNYEIDKVTPAGTLSVIAGTGELGNPVAGPATSSPMENPFGVAVDASGNVAFSNGFAVYQINRAGILSVLAGTGNPGRPRPGPARLSPLGNPYGLAFDATGNLYLADGGNHLVEKVSPAGVLSVVAGNGQTGRATPGPALESKLSAPTAVTVDPAGNVIIDDSSSGSQPISMIERLTPAGTLSIIAGTGAPGVPTYGAPATASALDGQDLSGAVVGPDGSLYIADNYNFTVDRVGYTTPGAPTAVTATPAIDAVTVTWHAPTNPGGPGLTGYRISLVDHTSGATRLLRVGPILAATVPAIPSHRYTVTVSAVTPARTGPPSTPSPLVTALPRPRLSVQVPPLSVLADHATAVPVTCAASTGQLTGCTVTLTTHIGNRTVILGTGRRLTSRGTRTRQTTLDVVLTPAGRRLAGGVGGVPATATATIGVAGSQHSLAGRGRTRIVDQVTLDPNAVHFSSASATLSLPDRRQLMTLRQYLSGVRVVKCFGYTDNRDAGAYNKSLGLARAKAVCEYLAADTHLKTIVRSFGEARPAASNRTPNGRAANRRAVVTLDY